LQDARRRPARQIGAFVVIPYSDSVRSRTTPFVNLGIIVICTVVFLAEFAMDPRDLDQFIFDWGVRPILVKDALQHPSGADTQVWFTLFTAMFLHGGLLHLGGNMIFLWVFGDNVEDQFGHAGYLIFYLVCGLAATFTQIAVDPNSPVPTIGASGAISGVLGGYLIFFPTAKVKIVIPIYFIPFPAVVSAGFLLIAWIVLQVVSGAISVMDVSSGEGIAWFAHVGGFAMGLVLCGLWRIARPPRGIEGR
jgi:membrane associated rhomboid family serine protease